MDARTDNRTSADPYSCLPSIAHITYAMPKFCHKTIIVNELEYPFLLTARAMNNRYNHFLNRQSRRMYMVYVCTYRMYFEP